MDNLQSVKDLPEVSFIDNDTLDQMQTRLVSNFEAEFERLTGRKISLAPADPNRILLYAAALQMYQIEQYVDRAGKQDLLKYSYGGFLDNLAGTRGVFRIQPSPARTTVRFTLSAVRSFPVAIPEKTMVTNGEIYFTTDAYQEIPAGQLFSDVLCTATVNGIRGNDLLPGQINTMVDLIGYVESVSNITVSSGGAELETDESLAERVFLAPSTYSVAGPDDAYQYFAKAFSPAIGDVHVSSPNPVEVEIRFLMANGDLPTTTLLQDLESYLSQRHIRPLTDQVTVLKPDTVNFSIDLTYYINRSDRSKAATIQAEVDKAVDAYIDWQTRTIGRDINPSELIRRVMAAGAKRVEIASPNFTAISDAAVARSASKTVTYGGLEND